MLIIRTLRRCTVGQTPEINNARSYLCDSLRAAHLNISISVRSKLLYLHVDDCICFCIYNVDPLHAPVAPKSKKVGVYGRHPLTKQLLIADHIVSLLRRLEVGE